MSGSLDRTIRVWDVALHEPICDGELKGHRGGVTSIAYGGHRLFRSLHVITASDSQALKPLSVSVDRLVSGSTDCTIKLWDLATMKEEAKFGGHTGLVSLFYS